MSKEYVSINASLVNPADPTEVNVLTAVAGVGTTERLASGHKIRWTADRLREFAPTLVNKPVNILLTAAGKASQHSRRAIGAVKSAEFDEQQGLLIANLALWEHYYPKTVGKVRDLYANKELNSSMEFSFPPGTLMANEDGSETPTKGVFSGVGLVDKPGDPRSMVYLLAALKEDDEAHNPEEAIVGQVIQNIIARLTGKKEESPEELEALEAQAEELEAAHEGSLEWTRNRIYDHLKGDSEYASCVILATYSNYAIYQEGEEYYRIDFKRSGKELSFGEPQAVDPYYQPTAKASAEESGDDPADNAGNLDLGDNIDMTPEEAQAQAAQIEELHSQLAEVTAALATANASLDAMKAATEAREAEEKANQLADERLAEIEKITPVKDELKAALRDSLKALDDAAYEVVKANFAKTTEIAAGIAPTDELTNPDPTPTDDGKTVPEETMKRLQAEAMAQFGTGNKSDEDKE